ncbi:MAG: hypothetical protein SF051_11300 [Elusimicrobiota bacterium]|nr:hypothetical protein [Elusimicrobiota bacterium]
MKSALLAVAVLVLPALSQAREKYVVRNGRAVTGGGGGGRASAGGGGAAAVPAAVQRGGGVSEGPRYGAPTGNQAFVAGGARRSSGGHRSFYGGARRIGSGAYRIPQRALEGGGSGETGEEPAPEQAPPHFSKPGALIRTEGHRRFEYAEPAQGERQTGVAAGEIALVESRAHHVNRSHGLRVGARDTPPPCTPGSNGCGGGSGGSSITPNTTVVNEGDVRHNGAHDNQNGGGNGNGQGNGNGFGGGTGFDPSF